MSKPIEQANGPGSQVDQTTDLREQLAQARAELNEARKTVEELKAANAALQRQLAVVEAKRAAYAEWLTAVVPPPPPFTEEELIDLRRNGVTLDEFLAEIDPAKGA